MWRVDINLEYNESHGAAAFSKDSDPLTLVNQQLMTRN